MIRAITALLVAALSAAAIAQAPANPPVRIRGTVEKLDGQMLTVKARNGETLTVKLADNFVVMGIAKASIADVASGKFIGTTTVGERQGALVALEVHIFPENMRGTGEGHYDWDLRPTSKMTNANVANVVSMGKGPHPDGAVQGRRKESPDSGGCGDRLLHAVRSQRTQARRPGLREFAAPADGSLTAPRVNVGLNGQVPPM